MLIGAALLVVPIVLPPILALNRAGRTIQSRIAQAVLVASSLFVVVILLVLFKQ
jgi:hypothetical protein